MTPFLRKLLGMNWMLVLIMYGLIVHSGRRSKIPA